MTLLRSLCLALMTLLLLSWTGSTTQARTRGVKVPRKLSLYNRAKLHTSYVQARRSGGDNPWLKVHPRQGNRFNVVVEIPKGTRKKMELDVGSGRFKLDRTLPRGFKYPVNYGLLPGSYYHDGDPLDVLLLGGREATGAVVRSRIVGVLYLKDEKGLDSKLIAVPERSPVRRLKDLPAQVRTDLTTFFNSYKRHEAARGKYCEVLGWGGKRKARREARRAVRFMEREASR